jgi:hypothetical protein
MRHIRLDACSRCHECNRILETLGAQIDDAAVHDQSRPRPVVALLKSNQFHANFLHAEPSAKRYAASDSGFNVTLKPGCAGS